MHVYTDLLNKLKLRVDNISCTAESLSVAMVMRNEDKGSLSLFYGSLFYMLFLFKHLHTLLQVTVNCKHVQPESPLASFLPFFSRSLRPDVWVGLSCAVTFCRNYPCESLMGVRITWIVLVSASILPPTLSWREMCVCVHSSMCWSLVTKWFSLQMFPVQYYPVHHQNRLNTLSL